jgi:HEAT repeat protein
MTKSSPGCFRVFIRFFAGFWKFLSDTAESADGNAEVQVQAVRAISERPKEEAVPILLRIAKTHPNQAVRRQAIRALGESGRCNSLSFPKQSRY